MKNKRDLKKFTYVIIALVFLVILVLGPLNKFGYLNINTEDSEDLIVDVWQSEPIGEIGYYRKVVSEKNGDIAIYAFKSKDKQLEGNIVFTTESIKNLTYSDCSVYSFESDSKHGKCYYGFIVPLDCQYVLVEGVRLDVVDGNIETIDGPLDFRMCIGAVDASDVEKSWNAHNGRSQFVYVDSDGNSHLVKN